MVKHQMRMQQSSCRPDLDRDAITALSEDALRVVGGGFGLGEPPIQQPGNPGVAAPEGQSAGA